MIAYSRAQNRHARLRAMKGSVVVSIGPVKDESAAHPIATEWRPAFRDGFRIEIDLVHAP